MNIFKNWRWIKGRWTPLGAIVPPLLSAEHAAFRRLLIERSRRHRLGYTRAMSEMYRGNDPWDVCRFAPWSEESMGVFDAIHDFNNRIDADAMWLRAMGQQQ